MSVVDYIVMRPQPPCRTRRAIVALWLPGLIVAIGAVLTIMGRAIAWAVNFMGVAEFAFACGFLALWAIGYALDAGI